MTLLSRHGRRRRSILLALLSTALAVALVEPLAWLGLRLIDGHWTGHALLDGQRRTVAEGGERTDPDAESAEVLRFQRSVLHPYLGYVTDPANPQARQVKWFDTEAAEFGFPHTAHHLFQTPHPGRVVVGIFGGSVASLFATVGGAELAEELAAYPRFRGKEVVVVSLGAGGYKQPQQLMTLNYLLALGAHFDVVINLDGFNEVALPQAELLPHGIFPHYPRGWRALTQELSPELRRAVGHLEYLRSRRRELAADFRHWPWRFSFAAELVWRSLDRRLVGRIALAEVALSEAHAPRDDFQLHGPGRTYANDAEAYRDIAEVWRRSSVQMARISAAGGSEYYHFLQPNQYVEGSKPLSDEELAKAWRAGHAYRPGVVDGYPALQREAAKLAARGVAFKDLTGLFAGVREPLYIDACCHFNREGNALLAAAVARVVGPLLARPDKVQPGTSRRASQSGMR